MTRADEIAQLQARYRRLMDQHKTVTARTVLLRLRALMTRQISFENRQDRRKERKAA